MESRIIRIVLLKKTGKNKDFCQKWRSLPRPGRDYNVIITTSKIMDTQ